MKHILSLILSLAATIAVAAQTTVTWTSTVESTGPTSGNIVWKADIADGWHIYGTDIPSNSDMPTNPTSFTVNPAEGLVLKGSVTPSVPAKDHFDAVMNLNLPWWEGSVTFIQSFELASGTKGANITGTIHYMACSAKSCTPPATEEFSLTFGDTSGIPMPEPEPEKTVQNAAAPKAPATDNAQWWAPVDADFNAANSVNTSQSSWWTIMLLGFLGGLLALLTPCVWPMIPMTVSFFLKSTKNRRRSITNAIIYALSIVVIFLVLGIAITMAFGASTLNAISTSAIFNLLFFALLVVFAISFFGAFDIKLPSKWSNAVDNKAETTTGIISIFFMAFTLVLVSFSCTGPIIGTLLVEAASQGEILGPAVGMGGFALGLALPFGLFAIFPSFLQAMPKSGGWLNSVKVVLGFIELILSLKFLSIADLAYGWRILDREVFLSLWIVLFALLGCYLLGKLRFSHDYESKHTSVGGFFLASISFAFAVYLLPGLWGAPLKAVSAFAPPLSTQDFNLYGGQYQEFHDYDQGMAYAAEHNKPVFVDFTGYGCVNCREMEMAVFDKKEVRSVIEQNYVLIKLYVDDKQPLAEPYKVDENGKVTKINTIGDRWSYLQRHKFGINSQPYYVLLDNAGQPLAPPREADTDVDAFVEWLQSGLDKYTK